MILNSSQCWEFNDYLQKLYLVDICGSILQRDRKAPHHRKALVLVMYIKSRRGEGERKENCENVVEWFLLSFWFFYLFLSIMTFILERAIVYIFFNILSYQTFLFHPHQSLVVKLTPISIECALNWRVNLDGSSELQLHQIKHKQLPLLLRKHLIHSPKNCSVLFFSLWNWIILYNIFPQIKIFTCIPEYFKSDFSRY